LRVSAGLLATLFATGSGATTLTLDFEGPIPGLPDAFNDGIAKVQAVFDFDPSCSSDCVLAITLTYLDFYLTSEGDGSTLQTIGQTLSGITFEPASGDSINVDLSSSTVSILTSIFVGSGASQASSDLGTNVTHHWGFAVNAALPGATGSTPGGPLGSHVLSSVGDAGVIKDGGGNVIAGLEGVIGMDDLFTSGVLSNVETNPPDGTSFSLVDGDTCDSSGCGSLAEGFQNSLGRVWIQSQIKANLVYDGTLTNIASADPIFGTEGLPIPEPGTAALVGFGLLGLLAVGRRGF
jgi:hypothetical protein